ncbi:DUF1259 domain-containing protein [Pseudomonas sp. Q2-TVG4-2]|uniref:DUF1259 domain-containing protein n=1 Tax=Pseudomonas sp. Q2-TVG4-2 TaxID=1685699 RepID=UPI0015E7B201|nr:DUF1259 domain-containing protein [Pseudomonas sp. Q2-TVG4-2]
MNTPLFRALAIVSALLVAPISIAGGSIGPDLELIRKATDAPVTVKPDGVVRISWQRDDVPVMVDGVKLPAPAGLGSWAAFKAVPDGGVMLMGDTVVFEDEITPAMDAAFAHGLEITALHNHFVFDRPPVYFMHIGGHEQSAEKLALGVKAIWDAIKAVRKEHATPVERSSRSAFEITGQYDIESLKTILDAEGSLNGPVLKFTFGRSAMMHGADFGESMGLSTWAAFSGSEDQAIVDGDFAMTADEVQPVMHALRSAGIHIVALHNHMIGETPPYYFLHYWGSGKPEELARGVRSALDTQQKPGAAH